MSGGVSFWPVGGSGGGGGGTAPLADKVALGSAATSAAITFGTPFLATPVVVAWLTSSAVSPDQIFIIGTAVTLSGFTVTLSTQTPDTTYTLNWIASAVND